jgi:hypothetical protein
MSLRAVDKATGRAISKVDAGGENRREAVRERRCREVTEAINRGHRNQAIDNFLKHKERDL